LTGVLATATALVAFAANSLLCRGALGHSAIDAASFTSLRLIAGALTLGLLSRVSARGEDDEPSAGSWPAAVSLFVYAAAFSFAYVSLTVATGALLLFGSVQVTMIAWGLVTGERPRRAEWIGLVVAIAGLTVLVLPGLAAPSVVGSSLMIAAGIAWGVYSLLGRGVANPIAATTANFVRTVPLTAVLSLGALPLLHLEARGAALAVLSGAVTSGLGYVVWYRALRSLTAVRAATVQLAVPLLSAFGGVLLLGEAITLWLVLSAVLILAGVGWALPRRANAR
jgi:drug/metabolite transporter (DMT)-like permease